MTICDPRDKSDICKAVAKTVFSLIKDWAMTYVKHASADGLHGGGAD